MWFLSKTQILEDHCNRSDDVDSHPDALIHKASIAFKIQMSGRQGNTVWTRLKSGKNFSEIFGKPIVQLSVRTPYEYRPDGA
jgi:hypothetical protein